MAYRYEKTSIEDSFLVWRQLSVVFLTSTVYATKAAAWFFSQRTWQELVHYWDRQHLCYINQLLVGHVVTGQWEVSLGRAIVTIYSSVLKVRFLRCFSPRLCVMTVLHRCASHKVRQPVNLENQWRQLQNVLLIIMLWSGVARTSVLPGPDQNKQKNTHHSILYISHWVLQNLW